MSLPPVVSDVEGPCPARYEVEPAVLADMRFKPGDPAFRPHVWEWSNQYSMRIYEVCRYCGGRKP